MKTRFNLKRHFTPIFFISYENQRHNRHTVTRCWLFGRDELTYQA